MTARPSPHRLRTRTLCALPFLCLLSPAAPLLHAQRVPVATRVSQSISASAAIDAGQLPISEPLTLTIHLQPTAAQTSALDQLLAAQTDNTSPSFHHWLTPQQFAEQFGATGEQLSAVTNYLESHGLAVASISPAHTRLTVTGTAGQAQLAFITSLHRFSVNGAPYFANAAEPTLPAEIAPLIAGISGLDNLPQPASARIGVAGAIPATAPRLAISQATPPDAEQTDDLIAIASAIDANTSPILNLATTACSTDLTPADVDAFRALFRQAAAQGITVLATSSCQTPADSSFPASLAEVTALTTLPRETSPPAPGSKPALSGRPPPVFPPTLSATNPTSPPPPPPHSPRPSPSLSSRPAIASATSTPPSTPSPRPPASSPSPTPQPTPQRQATGSPPPASASSISTPCSRSTRASPVFLPRPRSSRRPTP